LTHVYYYIEEIGAQAKKNFKKNQNLQEQKSKKIVKHAVSKSITKDCSQKKTEFMRVA